MQVGADADPAALATPAPADGAKPPEAAAQPPAGDAPKPE